MEEKKQAERTEDKVAAIGMKQLGPEDVVGGLMEFERLVIMLPSLSPSCTSSRNTEGN